MGRPRPQTLVPLERLPVPDVLATIEPFVTSHPAELEALAQQAVRVRRGSGTTLVEEGTVADGVYVVLRGRVNLVRRGDGGRDVILSVLGPGEIMGETCVFDPRGQSTAAVVAVPSELLRLPAEGVAAHLRRHPEALMRLMGLVSEKLRDMENVASGLALCDVEERLRRTLARLAQRQGRRVAPQSGWLLAPVPTQSELARMVGSCRETVSRTLSSMAKDGLVSANGRRMIVDDRLMRGAA